MEIAVIGIFWLLLLAAMVFGDGRYLAYLLFSSLPFGAFAVIPTAITGGLTLTPAPMVAVLLCIRVILVPSNLFGLPEKLLDLRKFGILTLFLVTALIVTLVSPRLFEGQVNVIHVRKIFSLTRAFPLQPSAQNISQMAYLTISFLAVIAMSSLVTKPNMWAVIRKGLMISGLISIITGLLSMVSVLSPLLQPFRTATYTLLEGATIAGISRVIGLMPEASVYGALCVGLLSSLHFLGRIGSISRSEDLARSAIVLGLIAMTVLSTSSSAYVGLAAFGAAAFIDWAFRLTRTPARSPENNRAKVEAFVAMFAIMCAVAFTSVNNGVLVSINTALNSILFLKQGSISFIERSYWSAVSWQALWDTYGLGVGVGSTRTSNTFVAITSNTGILGAVLFYGFLFYHYLKPLTNISPWSQRSLSGARWAYLPILVIGLLAGTVVDFGIISALLFSIFGSSSPAHKRHDVISNRATGPSRARNRHFTA